MLKLRRFDIGVMITELAMAGVILMFSLGQSQLEPRDSSYNAEGDNSQNWGEWREARIKSEVFGRAIKECEAESAAVHGNWSSPIVDCGYLWYSPIPGGPSIQPTLRQSIHLGWLSIKITFNEAILAVWG